MIKLVIKEEMNNFVISLFFINLRQCLSNSLDFHLQLIKQLIINVLMDVNITNQEQPQQK